MISFFFVDTERVWRGGQEQLLTLLQGLLKRGHKIYLVCQPNTLLEERARQSNIQIFSIAIPSEIGFTPFLRLLAALLRTRPDILAFNTPKPILLGTLVSRLTSVNARIIFRRVNFPLRKNFFTHLKYTWGINCIIAISESIRSQLLACGVPNSKIKTIYEGMDLSLYPKRNYGKKCYKGKPVTIGTTAHLSKEKGFQYLIEAASLIRDVRGKMRFIIVGDGDCMQDLKKLVQQRGLEECFQFTGFQNEPIKYLESFDIFALPSLSEGLSSAILTAMATSLPVIATDVGGIPELVQHGANGLLVPPADAISLAQAIQQLAEDPDECIRMGERGRHQIEEKFTLERKIQETEQLCRSLLEESASISRAAHV